MLKNYSVSAVSYTHLTGKRFVKEFKFENADEYQLAQEIKADIFEAGDKVDATAISKGKGFQGAIKRHNQHRGPMAHGSKFHRHAGSNGAASDPSKVFKGKKMPGHMGACLLYTSISYTCTYGITCSWKYCRNICKCTGGR